MLRHMIVLTALLAFSAAVCAQLAVSAAPARAAGVTAAAPGGAPAWEQVSALVTPENATLRAVLMVSDKEMYAAFRSGGVRYTKDRGATWSDVTGELAGLIAEKMLLAGDGTVLVSAAGRQGGIFRLVKGAWVKGANSPTGISHLTRLSDQTVLAYGGMFRSGGTTIFRSTDHGATWTKGAVVNTGIGQVMAQAHNGDLWIGAEASGLIAAAFPTRPAGPGCTCPGRRGCGTGPGTPPPRFDRSRRRSAGASGPPPYRSRSSSRELGGRAWRHSWRASVRADARCSVRSKASRTAEIASGDSSTGNRRSLRSRWRILLRAMPRAQAPNDRRGSYRSNCSHRVSATSWKTSSQTVGRRTIDPLNALMSRSCSSSDFRNVSCRAKGCSFYYLFHRDAGF
ncbi:MAG TPA: hypothetical protein VFJ30_02840 [Phycisphaerae bacterium]|nr:hypothetical protein [Phycisphaerae bacterium]